VFLLAAYCYSWNCWPTFFINKKRWENKKNVKERVKNVFFTSVGMSVHWQIHQSMTVKDSSLHYFSKISLSYYFVELFRSRSYFSTQCDWRDNVVCLSVCPSV